MDMYVVRLISTSLSLQSNQVKSSYHMELKGLQLCKKTVEKYKIQALITDRHPQIAKWLRETWKIPHFYDCWHIVKSKTFFY
jgi:solute carrier family 8 (sodium/calcium exchanger)